MKINNFLMILGLSTVILSPISFAQGSQTDDMGTGSMGAQSSTGASNGLPTREVTIDPANARSEEAYPAIKHSEVDSANNPNAGVGSNNQIKTKSTVMEHHKQHHEHMKKSHDAMEKKLQTKTKNTSYKNVQ